MLTPPQNLAENSRKLRARIAAAAAAAGRSVDSITLLAVSKGQSTAAIETLAHLGQKHFGENYLQEALLKMTALRGLELTWHFIGQLQANKTRLVAENFHWVHTIDRLKLAERLSAQRPQLATPLQVCLQVKLGDEPTKGGVAPAQLSDLVDAVRALPRLQLRGLMCVPPVAPQIAAQRLWFAQVAQLRDDLSGRGAALDTLSMGMSDDLEAAIVEGSTLVRIGTALFGPRAAPVDDR